MKLGTFRTIGAKVPRPLALLLGALPILVLLVIWWALTRGEPEERVIQINILPSPWEVLTSVPALLHRELPLNTWVSMRRIAYGYILALAVVLPLGILLGSFNALRAMLAPTTTASGYIPIATLLPLTMSWFGTGEKQKVIFLAMAFGIYLLPLVGESIAAVPEVYLRTAYTLGASKFDVVWRVRIPVALPRIWQGMRLAFGVGWTYLVLTEVVAFEDGLGTLIAISQRRGPKEHIYLVIMLITLIAWVADLLWVKVGEWLFPYQGAR